MTEITVADSAGFCFGVDRAVKMVYNELDKGAKVATFGAIIHNKDVVNDMTSRGVRIINSVDELQPDETVVIRSHGVGRNIYEQIRKKGNRLLDATCPFVSKIHRIVEEKTREDCFILIAGDSTHPEVQGIVGHCEQNYSVFKDNFELKHFFENLDENFKKTIAFIAQTTYNILVWENCLKEIPENIPVIIYDTICNATSKRQSDACELAKKSDIMIVVGGKHSSNTVKLYDVCSKYCRTYHIENSAELESFNIPFAENIGITAGASTPAYIIKEVLTKMAEIEKETIQEEENFQELLDRSFKKIYSGEKVKALVESVNNTEVVVSLGTKHTGYVKLEDLTDDLTQKPEDIVSVGEEIELVVIKVNDAEGTVSLSKKKVDEQAGYDKIVRAKEEGTVLEGVVQHIVNKGVTLNIYGVRVFIPASHTGLARGEELESLKGKKVQFMVIEVTEGRKRAVGSIKAVRNAEREQAKAKFWESTSIGDTFTGKVKSLTSFGAFVDLGGIDGMVHISELSWKRLRHPSEVVSIGDTLEVYIKDLDKESGRISLGHRKSEENPWEIFMNNYKVGDVVNVTIVSITAYGAFAQIIDGVDGLIHISRIANRKVENVKDVLSVGDEVTVKITNIEEDRKRVSISIRDVEDSEISE